MTCFAMLDSEEPWQGSIPDRGQLLVNPKTVNQRPNSAQQVGGAGRKSAQIAPY